MTLYAGVPLKPGDYMDLEFQTPGRTRVCIVQPHWLLLRSGVPDPAGQRGSQGISVALGCGKRRPAHGSPPRKEMERLRRRSHPARLRQVHSLNSRDMAHPEPHL
jgi:hypothetical protein